MDEAFWLCAGCLIGEHCNGAAVGCGCPEQTERWHERSGGGIAMSPSSTDRTPCDHGMPSKGACVECMYDEGLGGEPKEPVTARYAFVASYDGHCPGCNLPISVGQRLIALSNETYVHEECANG